MAKDFDNWSDLKQKLDARERGRSFNERELWWCSIGVNVGFEVFGKNAFFNRPVLVLRKFSRFTFLGAPTTSNCDERPFRIPISLNDKHSLVILDQARCFDSRRLMNRMGTLPEDAFSRVTNEYKALF